MALGKRKRQQQETFWVAAGKLGSGPRNAFYDRLNQLLDEIDFDGKLEEAAEPFCDKTGRKGLPPGVYFRMIFIGYFKDISSQRGIAWRCDDSRSLARFLGYAPGESTPDHSTLSLTRERLPMEIHQFALELILAAARDHGLLQGKTIGVDATDSLIGAGKPRYADVLSQRALSIYFAPQKRLRILQAFVTGCQNDFNRVSEIEVATVA